MINSIDPLQTYCWAVGWEIKRSATERLSAESLRIRSRTYRERTCGARTYAVRSVECETTRNVLVRVRSTDQQRDVDLDIFERRRSQGERGVGVHQQRNRFDDDCAISAVMAVRSALTGSSAIMHVDLDNFERRRSRGERGFGVHQRRNRLDDDCAISAVLAARSALSRVRTPLLLAQRKCGCAVAR